MSDDSDLSIDIVQSIGDVAPKDWDALVPEDDPFTTHAFLAALERSESACAQTGWMPLHVICRRGEKFVGAATGGQLLELRYEGPGIEKQIVPVRVFSH